jgi:hypothetical protein
MGVARIIREKRPQNAKKVPTIELPNFLVRLVAFFDASIRQVLPELGRNMQISQAQSEKSSDSILCRERLRGGSDRDRRHLNPGALQN